MTTINNNDKEGFVYSADADADADVNACNVARVSCNVARVSCNVARVSCNVTGNTCNITRVRVRRIHKAIAELNVRAQSWRWSYTLMLPNTTAAFVRKPL